MKPKKYFYYLLDPKTDKKRVTVCILKAGDSLSRGIAICSSAVFGGPWVGDFHPEQFNKKLGRTIAEGRAWKAFRSRNTDTKNIVRNEYAMEAMPGPFFDSSNELFLSKSEWMPELTKYEKVIIGKE